MLDLITPETVKTLDLLPLASLQIDQIVRIGNGVNSRAYKLLCSDGTDRVIKFYPWSKTDNRDRLETEIQSLHFLAEHKFSNVPTVLGIDKKNHCALLSFVEGINGREHAVNDSDLDQAILFLQRLKEVSPSCKVERFLPASEASFTIGELIASIASRLLRLQEVQNERLKQFLPHIESFFQNLDQDQFSVEQTQRVLSPSDFGFHNALRDEDGNWSFLDFEYFGWDDPAKTASDFILHPGMSLTTSQKIRFLSECLRLYGGDQTFYHRLQTVFPLYLVKWCIIILNPFLKESRSWSVNASQSDDQQGKLEAQLKKAKSLLESAPERIEMVKTVISL